MPYFQIRLLKELLKQSLDIEMFVITLGDEINLIYYDMYCKCVELKFDIYSW